MPELLEIENLKTHFFTGDGVAKAVDGVSLTARRGETLGIVGESGCGKTVTSKAILRLLPDRIGFIKPGSQVKFRGDELTSKSEREMRTVRGDRIAMIFQEPMTALTPPPPTSPLKVAVADTIYDLDQGDGSVAVFEGDEGATIIWVVEDEDEISQLDTGLEGWA